MSWTDRWVVNWVGSLLALAVGTWLGIRSWKRAGE